MTARYALCILLSILSLAGCAAVDIILSEESDEKTVMSISGSGEFWRSSSCRGCHSKVYSQYAESMHDKSFENPVFQAQYFNEVVPSIKDNASMAEEAKKCIACHTPVSYIKNNGYIVSKDQVNNAMAGVTCDFCHTMTGFTGKEPGNGNYISSPGDVKYGPIPTLTDHHKAYSDFFNKSEFCAVCHNATNHNGIEIKSTFTEWKQSDYAKKNIQCQDCHMNIKGYLTGGQALFESGKVGETNWIQFKDYERLYTHKFPGAHNKKQVEAAISVSISEVNVEGEDMTVTVLVDNTNVGHMMPTGSAELRLLWLELQVKLDNNSLIWVPASSNIASGEKLDIAGISASDAETIGDDIPRGARIYRTVFADTQNKQTFSSYKAAKVLYDNRLNPLEVRKETYNFKLPKHAKNKLTLIVDLKYLPYPTAFSSRLGLKSASQYSLFTAERTLHLKR
ncbi:MAG: hypothetical protein EPN22_09740 [Nitrospirae bacterium]|nr:MAG: hypothetical protein EPN22_09740 [Nitrospirota bacterium]